MLCLRALCGLETVTREDTLTGSCLRHSGLPVPRQKLALVLYNQEGEEEAVNKHTFVGAGTEIRRHISFRDEMIGEERKGRVISKAELCGVYVWCGGGVLGMETGPLCAKKYSDRQINVCESLGLICRTACKSISW